MCKRSVCSILIVLLLLPLSIIEAKATFEGFWDQTTIVNTPAPGLKGEKTIKQRVFYKNGKMKMLNIETGEYSIYRFDKELVWQVNPAKKTYQEMTFADMEASMARSKDAMADMREKMKDMPPQQRKMMKKMMGSLGNNEPMSIKIVETKETKTINAHKCRKVKMIMGEDAVVIMWLTNKYDLGDEFVHLYKRMNMLKGDLPKNVSKLRGFAIQSISSIGLGNGKKMMSETSVLRIVPKKIPLADFSLPRGYKKMKFQMN